MEALRSAFQDTDFYIKKDEWDFLTFDIMNAVFVFFHCQRMSNTTQHSLTHSLTPQTHFPLFRELYFNFPTLLYTLHLRYNIQIRSIKLNTIIFYKMVSNLAYVVWSEVKEENLSHNSDFPRSIWLSVECSWQLVG